MVKWRHYVKKSRGGWKLFSPAVAWRCCEQQRRIKPLKRTMLQHKQSDPSTKAKSKPRWGITQSNDCAAKNLSAFQTQNLQSHLFRFSLQMWRDAKNQREKTGRQEKWPHESMLFAHWPQRTWSNTLCVRMWFGKARWKPARQDECGVLTWEMILHVRANNCSPTFEYRS